MKLQLLPWINAEKYIIISKYDFFDGKRQEEKLDKRVMKMLKNGKIRKLFAGFLSACMAASLIVTGTPALETKSEASESDPVVIVLDPGHDFVHRGAHYDYTAPNITPFSCDESEANLAMALACRDELMKYSNIKIYMTSEHGECMGNATNRNDSCLTNRLAMADKVEADLYVSFHCNSGGTIGVTNGSEVYISLNTPFNENEKQLAEDILTGLKGVGFNSRGIKTRRSSSSPNSDYLAVNRRAVNYGFPSVLIEHGFVNHIGDAKKLSDPNILKQIGQSDAAAIAKYFHLKKTSGDNSALQPNVETTCHFAHLGWTATMPDGLICGTKDYAYDIQAIRLNVNNNGVSGGVQYQTYVTGRGWQNAAANGVISGTVGEALPIEAVNISLTGDMAKKYDIYYRVFSLHENKWLGWAANGNPAGRTKFGDSVTGLQVKTVPKGSAAPGSTKDAYAENTIPDTAQLVYTTHVQSFGWKEMTYDGNTSGTVNQAKRLEAIKIFNNTDISGDIEYQVHAQSYGWMDWVKNGTMAGTSGEAKRLEAIRIRLTGELAEKYDIYYRVHCQSYGWMGWAKNGECAGTSHEAKRLEAIEIKLVEKGGDAPGTTDNAYRAPKVVYQTHVQTYGWQSEVWDSAVSGTSGQAKRLEAIKITNNTGIAGDIEYQVHCQTYGWMDWVKNGGMAGTSGKAKRLEAIRIRLTGELAEKYDVYYRVHCQTYGWMDWASNGDPAGSEGLYKRLEAIQIVLVEKGGAAPGSTERPFIK